MLEKIIWIRRLPVFLVVIGLIFTTLAQNSVNEVTVILNHQHDPMSIDITGLSATLLQTLAEQDLSSDQWQQFFQITIVDEQHQGTPQPMLGNYSTEAESLRFTPQFPLIAGQTYQATFFFNNMFSFLPDLLDNSSSKPQQETIISEFVLPKPNIPTTEVTKVYPSSDQLPENLLRFYIYFSAPMREGFALKQIHLIDSQGKKVEGVFFDPIFELWDPSMQRLTLLFDPGRVKKGLKAHEKLGRALTVGQTYALAIGEDMLDANSNSLARAFAKTFTVIEADLSPPDVNLWQISNPKSGSTDALTVHFPAPLDHVLLTEFVQVHSEEGKVLQGEIRFENNETIWNFIPTTPWQTGKYELLVNTSLEDIAGNNLQGLFDIPPEEKLKFLNQETVTLAFQIE